MPGARPAEDRAFSGDRVPAMIPATALAAAEHRRPVPAIAAFTARQFEPALGERLPVRAIGTDGVAGFDDVVRAHGFKPPCESCRRGAMAAAWAGPWFCRREFESIGDGH